MSTTGSLNVGALADGLSSGRVEIVELTQPLSERTPVIELPPPFASTPRFSREQISHFDDRGPDWAWSTLTLGEHTGTHLDAPIHWISGRSGADVASIPLTSLVGPACVVDVTAQVERDPGYLLTTADLEAWEAEHGVLPPGAWVLMRTGWSARIDDEAAFLNVGASGPESPGPSVEAARWLARQRPISGFGVETVGIDAGAAATFSTPVPAHYYLLGAGRFGLTQLANLDRLPAAGALIVVAPLPIVGGTASPCRVMAFVDRD